MMVFCTHCAQRIEPGRIVGTPWTHSVYGLCCPGKNTTAVPGEVAMTRSELDRYQADSDPADSGWLPPMAVFGIPIHLIPAPVTMEQNQ